MLLKVGNVYKIDYKDSNPYNGLAILVDSNPCGFEKYRETIREYLLLDDKQADEYGEYGYFEDSCVVGEFYDMGIDQSKIFSKDSLILQLYKRQFK